MNFICYNYQILPEGQAFLAHSNAAFRSGSGLIETMLWEKGAIRFWKEHYGRLRESAARLNWRMEIPEPEELRSVIKTLILENKIAEQCIVRLQAFPEAEAAGFVLETFPFPESEKSIRVGIAQGIRKSVDDYSDLKTSSRLIYQLARQQAGAQGWSDALLLNQEGRIVESTIANIFWIKNKQVFTPPLEEGCIAGIMRQQILSGKMNIHQLPATERILTMEEARSADQLLLVSAVRGIRIIDAFCSI